MKRTLITVTQLANRSPFSEGQLRWWIFESSRNGLDEAGAIVRIGRRVYIDLAAFDSWIDQQQSPRTGHREATA